MDLRECLWGPALEPEEMKSLTAELVEIAEKCTRDFAQRLGGLGGSADEDP